MLQTSKNQGFRTVCGGGLNLDLTNPDVISGATMANGATRTIAVTQIPRFVIYAYSRTNSNGYGGVYVEDIEKSLKAYSIYGSSGYKNSKNSSSLAHTIAVSNTSITIKNDAPYEVRTQVLIYY